MTSSQHHSRPLASRFLFSTATVVAFILFPLSACIASSPYELDIGELERPASPAKSAQEKPRREVKRSRARVPTDPGRATAKDLEGEFVNYTIRPGDHIFKVLTERFGLSSARAEEMIPRILRVNGIRDVRGLQVGRTIRIPVPEKSATPPAPPSAPPVREENGNGASITPEPMPPTAPPATEEKQAAVPPPTEKGTPEERAPETPPAATAIPAPTGESPREVPDEPSPPPAAKKTVVRIVPAGDPAATADAIMDALSLTWSKAHPVIIPLGGGGGASLTIPVDRYFEARGKRFFLDFGGADPDGATLVRLVEMAGYRRIQIGKLDDFRTVAAKLLEALEIKSDYRKHLISPAPGGTGGTYVSGFLIFPPDGTGKRLFLTDIPVTGEIRDKAGSGLWEIK